jgi:hypothetical protein
MRPHSLRQFVPKEPPLKNKTKNYLFTKQEKTKYIFWNSSMNNAHIYPIYIVNNPFISSIILYYIYFCVCGEVWLFPCVNPVHPASLSDTLVEIRAADVSR